MIDTTHQAIQDIAERAGWGDYTIVLLIARWATDTGQAQALLDYLDQTASEEDEAGALD